MRERASARAQARRGCTRPSPRPGKRGTSARAPRRGCA
ncbi:MAG: hypothetical protein BLITH_0669 [Brockia lithotrophica]|uniref:Uncharacterized protein n=1 Tax=Brockia lithotrophica TaxID=933949 RepID=A0A2T5G8I5_9BACL|nr:MAG: hypothetical protein BLITH_0669 [Brockia lithotrophica]